MGRLIDTDAGPRCPSCNCAHSHELAQFEWMGSLHSKRQCRHCLKVYAVPMEPEAPLVPAPVDGLETKPVGSVEFVTGAAIRCTCPKCKGHNPKVGRTVQLEDRVLRYHKCHHCRHTFKSTEFMAARK